MTLHYIEAFRGSVNRWECDENDHLNVRFYNRMTWECLHAAAPEIGLGEAWRVSSLHMRFLAEARLATPVAGYCALVGVAGETVTTLVELRNPMSDVVLANFVCELHVPRCELVEQPMLPLPPGTGARGLTAERAAPSAWNTAEAAAMGLANIGRGAIRPEECGADGTLSLYGYMGRMSDSMPHLWGRMQTEEELAARSDGFQGGAVLEYRMDYHDVLRTGDTFQVWSGLRHVGEKIQHFEHLMFHGGSGQCVMSAQAIGVVLDLKTRRSVPIPEARRRRMLGLMIGAQ